MALSTDPIDLSVQSRPNEFEYLIDLDQGSSSSAYLAIDRRVERGARLVVVHMAHPAIARDPGFRAAFAARGSVAQALCHPNIVRTLDLVAEDRWSFWVTEFVPARTLAEVVAKRGRAEKHGARSGASSLPSRALSTDQYLLILRDVLVGLEHGHGLVDGSGSPSPVFHRNVCPSSVLVGFDGGVKINDYAFGGAPEVTFGRLEGAATRLAYFAPERCLGRPMDARCDVYAVGGMLWEALTGGPRRSGANLQEALQVRLRDADPKVEDVCPDVAPALAAIARRALAWEPGERYQTAREFRLELDAHLLDNDVRSDHGALFGFMCNHFCEEYDDLERLLESRARSLPRAVRPAARVLGGDEPLEGTESATHTRPAPELEPGSDSGNGPRLSAFVRTEGARMKGLGAPQRRLGLWMAAGGACVALGYPLLSWTFSSSDVSPSDVSSSAVSPSVAGPSIDRPEARELSQAQHSLRPQLAAPEPERVAADEAEQANSGAEVLAEEGPSRGASRAGRRAVSHRRGAARKRASGSAAASKTRPTQPEVAAQAAMQSEDEGTLSELATTPVISSGADLRALRPRTARPIDKKDPYSQ